MANAFNTAGGILFTTYEDAAGDLIHTATKNGVSVDFLKIFRSNLYFRRLPMTAAQATALGCEQDADGTWKAG